MVPHRPRTIPDGSGQSRTVPGRPEGAFWTVPGGAPARKLDVQCDRVRNYAWNMGAVSALSQWAVWSHP
eukprot:11861068-Alexandrium_andersonii.AAC.1